MRLYYSEVYEISYITIVPYNYIQIASIVITRQDR